MFEFSFPDLIIMGLAGILLYHLYGKKVLGWVSKEEATLKAQLVLFEHRLGITEMALAPPTPAPAPIPAPTAAPAPNA